MIRFSKNTCGNLENALHREWLETNGLGGFALSTIAGLNTRRYHGLLVAASQPPVGRMVLLSKLEETLTVDGQSFELSANQYPGSIHPRGFEFLQEFRLDPCPTFVFEAGGVRVVKTVFMTHGENATVVQYELEDAANGKVIQMDTRPLIAFRDYHALTRENAALNPSVAIEAGMASVSPYFGLPTLYLAHNARGIDTNGSWYRNFQYEEERERGLDFTEDLFNPCTLQFDLAAGPANVIASTRRLDVAQVSDIRTAELSRREATVAQVPDTDEVTQTLAAASDQFIVARQSEKTVIAGYPWFSDWGRDTMISLPGLTLPTRRLDVARGILRTFSQAASQGMLPNRFPDAGEAPEYNTVDATLWFFEAVRAYFAASGDSGFVRAELYNCLVDIVDWHVRGTRYNIKVEADGLLGAGEDGVQLTWMDAKVGDHVITPRRGKPVEIQALWYNALCVMADMAAEFGDVLAQKRYSTMAGLTRWSFNQLFWREQEGCLYDVVDGLSNGSSGKDASIRPNQIFAISLHHTMLTRERAQRVVEVVREQLLTPYGLRTLAPGDPQYRGHYTGGAAERDAAYHQGTVWPWLIGPFITAYLRVGERSDAALRQAADWLAPLELYLMDQGVGQVPEIFSGDPPHNPGGCMAQAWSVAELLRVRMDGKRAG
jgi:predicted glycogen debranching enzyme